MSFDDIPRPDDQQSARLRLAAELAVGLARRLWMTLHYDATDAGFCWHMFQSTFVDGCYVLWELGVAGPPKPWSRLPGCPRSYIGR
jgi:hypothetical protein